MSATNPYRPIKLLGELERFTLGWAIAYLRYFNPVGAHPSGEIGEDPRGTPHNLLPYVSRVALGMQVYGNDYDTPDGTGVRHYIHVMDLAEGHVAALRHLLGHGSSLTVNLGTGRGHSVTEVIRAFERLSGRPVPYRVTTRRSVDVAACYADVSLARALLGWTASRELDQVRGRLCWQSRNPFGFSDQQAESAA